MIVEFGIEPLAENALLLRFGEGIDIDVNARVHAAARALRAAALPGITDIAPAYATLLVRFDPFTWIGEGGASPFERIAGRLRSIVEAVVGESSCGIAAGTAELQPSPAHPNPLLQTMEPFRGEGNGKESRDQGEGKQAARIRVTAATAKPPGRPIEIPVCYGGEYGPDLDAVAAHAGLAPDEVVARHTAAEYTVAMIGFAPGFPYLLGLDAALAMPRRRDPRTRVPAGSVAIGGAQTGIYPHELPGGWQLIGRTPLALFDPQREPPCLLAPGDRLRFRAIRVDEFEIVAGHPRGD
ncbi:MAG TPA: 5-oxoprolinase subunit PxpB [Rhodanobacteraceae bacterium]|nr:5-oxoprolinase subunit PxpB [Rhodanobacteraceae bacterium]